MIAYDVIYHICALYDSCTFRKSFYLDLIMSVLIYTFHFKLTQYESTCQTKLTMLDVIVINCGLLLVSARAKKKNGTRKGAMGEFDRKKDNGCSAITKINHVPNCDESRDHIDFALDRMEKNTNFSFYFL